MATKISRRALSAALVIPPHDMQQPRCVCGQKNWQPHVITEPTCRSCGADYPETPKTVTLTGEKD